MNKETEALITELSMYGERLETVGTPRGVSYTDFILNGITYTVVRNRNGTIVEIIKQD